LLGKRLDAATMRDFAAMLLRGAHGYRDNAFKIELAARVIARAFELATQRSIEETAP
jgi:xanthine dehydrogenase YagS FAD-binding subunit